MIGLISPIPRIRSPFVTKSQPKCTESRRTRDGRSFAHRSLRMTLLPQVETAKVLRILGIWWDDEIPPLGARVPRSTSLKLTANDTRTLRRSKRPESKKSRLVEIRTVVARGSDRINLTNPQNPFTLCHEKPAKVNGAATNTVLRATCPRGAKATKGSG